MEQKDYAVGLDIGTTKIVAMIGRKNEYGKLEVLGMGKSKSLGVRRGVVNNITQTIQSIQQAVDEAENTSGIKIEEVTVGIAGQHIRSLQHSEYITRDNAETVITQHDLNRLNDQVYKLAMMPGEELIHALPQEYKIDGQSNITEPIGMYGGRLEANFHLVIGMIGSIRNIYHCVKDTGIDLSEITLEPLASADAVLSREEKEAGVALIDIGGGTTDLAIFKDGIIRHTAVIPFGGNVITEDIKDACAIIEKQAELLKTLFGSAWPGENKDNEVVSIPGLRGREPKEISLKNLSKVIHSRVKMIIDQAFLEIQNYGPEESKNKLIAGIVLTGGGSQLKHLKQLVEYITGMDTRIGYPNEHMAGSRDNEYASPMYATAVGLMMKGLESKGNKEQTEDAELDTQEVQETPQDIENQPVVEDHTTMEEEEKPAQAEKPRQGIFERWVEKFKELLDNAE